MSHPLLSQNTDECVDDESMAAMNAPPEQQPVAARQRRRHDLDNLRSFLTALMILHHTAAVYGGSGDWSVRSPYFPVFLLLLTTLNTIDQTFFMGLLIRGIGGPVWYLAVVMILGASAVLMAASGCGNLSASRQTFQQHRSAIILLWMATILSSVTVRLFSPVTAVFIPLNLRLAYLPQCILAYIWGHLSALSDDLFVLANINHPISSQRALSLSLCASLLTLNILFRFSMLSAGSTDEAVQLFIGRRTIPALLYAV